MEWKRYVRCGERKPTTEFRCDPTTGRCIASVCISCHGNKPLKKDRVIATEKENLQKQETMRQQREQQKLDMQRKLIKAGLTGPLGL